MCANVCVASLLSYCKLSIVVQLHNSEQDNGTALFLAGSVTQIGSLIGAVIFFVLVNYTNVFQ